MNTGLALALAAASLTLAGTSLAVAAPWDRSRDAICTSYAGHAAKWSQTAKSVGCRLPSNLALSELQQYKWCMSASDDSHSRRSDKAHGVKHDMEVFCSKQSGATVVLQ